MSFCIEYKCAYDSVFLNSFAAKFNEKALWRNILTGGPWTNYIKGSIPHFEFTEEFIIIKVL